MEESQIRLRLVGGPFRFDKDCNYYIKQAGGVTGDGIHGDIRIIKAGSRQWLSTSETTIEDGDYVWVPKEPYRPFGYYMQVYSQIFSIVGTIATLVVLMVQLRK